MSEEMNKQTNQAEGKAGMPDSLYEALYLIVGAYESTLDGMNETNALYRIFTYADYALKNHKPHSILFSDRPMYVKLIKDKVDYVRGETLLHKNGKIFKVKTHGRTMTLEGALRWQRYSYNDFMPSTEAEYNEYISSLLNSEQNPERSVATEADSSNVAGQQTETI